MQRVRHSTIGIIPYTETRQIRTTIPNKFIQYVAGVPCIVSDVGPLARIVRETSCGIVFQPESTADFADKIVYALNHPDELKRMGSNGRKHAVEHYRWEIEGREYRNYLNSLRDNAFI